MECRRKLEWPLSVRRCPAENRRAGERWPRTPRLQKYLPKKAPIAQRTMDWMDNGMDYMDMWTLWRALSRITLSRITLLHLQYTGLERRNLRILRGQFQSQRQPRARFGGFNQRVNP